MARVSPGLVVSWGTRGKQRPRRFAAAAGGVHAPSLARRPVTLRALRTAVYARADTEARRNSRCLAVTRAPSMAARPRGHRKTGRARRARGNPAACKHLHANLTTIGRGGAALKTIVARSRRASDPIAGSRDGLRPSAPACHRRQRLARGCGPAGSVFGPNVTPRGARALASSSHPERRTARPRHSSAAGGVTGGVKGRTRKTCAHARDGGPPHGTARKAVSVAPSLRGARRVNDHLSTGAWCCFGSGDALGPDRTPTVEDGPGPLTPPRRDRFLLGRRRVFASKC